MIGKWSAWMGVAGLLLVGCGSGGDEKGSDVPAGVRDLRVAVPDADSNYLDLVTPEVTIEPGEEKMLCAYLEHDEADVAISVMESYQATYGHHIVLLSTLEPRPPGTFEDCTEAEDMWKFRAFMLPDTELPDGYGIKIPNGLQFVLQFHYVNAGPKPILVRDVARLKRVPAENVHTWVTTVTTNSLRVAIEPNQRAEESFDCVLPEDVELLVLGGHMHENGSTFEIAVGESETTLERMYFVDPWRAEFRDAPPVTLLFDDPVPLKKGSLLRTTCVWQNRTTKAIDFPEEMCAGFGYVSGRQEPVHCEP